MIQIVFTKKIIVKSMANMRKVTLSVCLCLLVNACRAAPGASLNDSSPKETRSRIVFPHEVQVVDVQDVSVMHLQENSPAERQQEVHLSREKHEDEDADLIEKEKKAEEEKTLVLDYSVIQATGKFCPGRDSCRQTRNHRDPDSVENDWKKRNCFCDDGCATYGDCCIDAPAYVAQEQRKAHRKFRCVNLKQYGDVYMVSRCPDEWNLPNIARACEHNDEVSDPFGSTPVTSEATGITYRNYYCAVCNGDSKGEASGHRESGGRRAGHKSGLVFWKPRLACPTLTSYARRFRNLTREFLAERLTYDADRGHWGVQLDSGGVEVFHECFVDPAVPDSLVANVRACPGRDAVADCAADWGQREEDPVDYDQTHELCHAYTAMVFEPNAAFRNVHCAMCNRANLDRLICLNLGPFGRFNWHQNFDAFSFAVLFDINGGGGGGFVGFEESTSTHHDHPKCRGQDELYDPFFRKCRNVVCGDDDDVFVQGRCFNPSRTTKTPTTTTRTTASATSTVTRTTTTSEAKSTTTTATTKGEIDGIVSASTTAPSPLLTSTSASIVTAESSGETTVTTPAAAPADNSSNVPPVLLAADQGVDNNEVEAMNGSNNSTNSPSGDKTRGHFTTFKPDEKSSAVNYNMTEATLTEKETPSAPKPSEEYLRCAKFVLEADEFEASPDGSQVYVAAYAITLGPAEFELLEDGSKVVVCAPQTPSTDKQARFGPVLAAVTLVGLCISSFCLISHIAVTLMVPELRNLSGKNLLSLSTSLLGGYVTFMVAMFARGDHDNPSCFFIAVTIYFFFLASFAWMLVIALDIYRTLKKATTKLRLVGGSGWGRFALYSTFGWLMPLAAAVLATLADVNEHIVPAWLRPHFGAAGLCWFANRTSLAVFFVAPFCAVACVNVVLFVSSANMVRQTTRATSKASTAAGTKDFKLYLRLATIMGVTWTVGLAAALVDVPILWYLFTGLNTLQGAFIFMSFTCTGKVTQGLRTRLRMAADAMSVTGGHGGHSGGRGSDSVDHPSWRLTTSTKKSNADSRASMDSQKSNAHVRKPSVETRKSHLDSSKSSVNSKPAKMDMYAATRGKTVYTVSTHSVNGGINQKSFDGRYF